MEPCNASECTAKIKISTKSYKIKKKKRICKNRIFKTPITLFFFYVLKIF